MVERIRVSYRDGTYRVDKLAWDGGEVVLASDYDTLARKCDALEKDAARYRWLRTFPNNVRQELYAACNLLLREEHLDAAIDAMGGVGD